MVHNMRISFIRETTLQMEETAKGASKWKIAILFSFLFLEELSA